MRVRAAMEWLLGVVRNTSLREVLVEGMGAGVVRFFYVSTHRYFLWNGSDIDINSTWIGSTDWHIGQLWPGTYYWDVRARNQYSESDPSSTWSFTVAEPATVGPLLYDSFTVDDDDFDESVGDGDSIVECGETIETPKGENIKA